VTGAYLRPTVAEVIEDLWLVPAVTNPRTIETHDNMVNQERHWRSPLTLPTRPAGQLHYSM
jgi:hypothetical protein